MADAVTTQTLFNGNRHCAFRFTNESDGTGESGVTKIDATSGGSLGVVVQGQTFYPGVHLKVVGIDYDIKSMGLRIQFHASSNADMMVLGGFGRFDYTDIGGIQNPGTAALSGSTGSIDFTTVDANLGASYSVVIRCTKGVPQS
jgi:hypothetical protein